jgi:hypothetical protein
MEAVLFVRMIPLWVTCDELAELFSCYGGVVWARIVTPSPDQESACGIVVMANPDEADVAIHQFAGRHHFGVQLAVERLFPIV